MWGLTVDVANRLTTLTGGAPGPGYPPNSGLSQKLQLAATLLSAGLGTRVDHDRLGQLRHARRPARRAGSAAHHALARPGRVQGRPRRARRRAERHHDGVLRVRAAPRGVRLGRHRPRLGRPDHAQRLGRQGRARRRAPGRQRQPGRRPRRQDRLPHRLPVADRRMAGRRSGTPSCPAARSPASRATTAAPP